MQLSPRANKLGQLGQALNVARLWGALDATRSTLRVVGALADGASDVYSPLSLALTTKAPASLICIGSHSDWCHRTMLAVFFDSYLKANYLQLSIHYSLLTTHYSLLTTHYSLLTYYLLLTTYYSLLTTHYSLTTYYSLLTTQYLLLTTHYSLLTTHYLLLTTHYSILNTCYSLLTTHYSLLTTHYPLPTTHYPLLTTHHSLLTTYHLLLRPRRPTCTRASFWMLRSTCKATSWTLRLAD